MLYIDLKRHFYPSVGVHQFDGLRYWSSIAASIFNNPENINLDRMLETLAGLHLNTTDDDYSYADVYKLLQEQNLVVDIIACIEGGKGFNTAYAREQVIYILEVILGETVILNNNAFIGYICLLELYNRYQAEVK